MLHEASDHIKAISTIFLIPIPHMAYYIDLFSPETYEAFTRSSRDVSGFRLRHKGMAERVKPGDMLVCYMTRLSRWFGVLEVLEGPFLDESPVFAAENDRIEIRAKLLQDIRRPVFLLLDIGQFAENCISLSRDSLHELGAEKHVPQFSDTVNDFVS